MTLELDYRRNKHFLTSFKYAIKAYYCPVNQVKIVQKIGHLHIYNKTFYCCLNLRSELNLFMFSSVGERG